MSPTAVAVAKIVKPGMKLTVLYKGYVEAQDQLLLAKQENKRVNKYLDEIIKEVEMKCQQEKYECMQKSVANLSAKLEDAIKEICCFTKMHRKNKQSIKVPLFLSTAWDATKMEMTNLVKGFLFILSFSFSFAFYFHQGEKEEKCIIEDIPADTLVTGQYKIQSWDFATHAFLPSAPGLGLFVNVRGPNEQILLHKLYGPESKFTFQSHSQGEHYICLISNSTKLAVFAGNRLRINLDIQVGEHSTDEFPNEAENKMNDVEERIQHLIEEMQYISKQQDYQRSREEEFRQISEGTNNSILCWAVIQTIILLTMGIWQMKHMKHFFIDKKLV
ncbi:transmembrane emp24 domain-containing protein 11-like [Narcine bancroftii]|uniref:transmembrane emp24 domain-containing protein 11-like n=1 Tax=Narcine bancroftii TaxID=1343680 RepID=UPI00383199FD